MKKIPILLFAVSLLAGFSSVAMGQSTDNETISANANVVQDLKVGEDKGSLEFGDVVVNSTKFIDAENGDVVSTGITGGEQRGFFDVQMGGEPNINLEIRFPTQLGSGMFGNLVTMPFYSASDGESAGTVNAIVTEQADFNGNLNDDFGTNILVNKTDWTITEITSTVTAETTSAVSMPSSSKIYVVVGGKVEAEEEQEIRSDYLGTIKLTVTVAD
ncbi:hypothetical protein [Gracilimonas halophila]|uniref:DUF4402 domain-containing protein n=1 Tax=Gracilimonas halophila TaxID=1834464 RepID=A0ABW5JK18_9BACT